jgi:hypothetical protein
LEWFDHRRALSPARDALHRRAAPSASLDNNISTQICRSILSAVFHDIYFRVSLGAVEIPRILF